MARNTHDDGAEMTLPEGETPLATVDGFGGGASSPLVDPVSPLLERLPLMVVDLDSFAANVALNPFPVCPKLDDVAVGEFW